MTPTATEGSRTSLRTAPARKPAASADELERLERELIADPCNLVRRACQLADYETGGPGSRGDDAEGR
jgi:hypothetical protein